MIGAQDLGGAMGFGPVTPEPETPVFHADWEKRAFALVMAAGFLGRWTIDGGRHARESLPASVYFTSSYYKIWFEALRRCLVASGLVAAGEIDASHPSAPAVPVGPLRSGADIAPMLAKGFPYDRPVAAPARFRLGDRLRTKLMYTTGHTRLPRYAFGKPCVVEAVRGSFVFPDVAAAGGGDAPQWLYTVRFAARDLWGEAATGESVCVDAWESYLEPA
jgi:nitrile hydratase